MSGFIEKNLGIAASIYLAFYVSFILIVFYVMFSVKSVWNRYFTLLLFAVFRITGSVAGIIFAKLGIEHTEWLIVYLVFSAEGYFSLILASFYLLVDEQKTFWGYSVFGAKNIQLIWRKVSIKQLFHLVLIPANILVIVGGTMLSGASDYELEHDQNLINTSKGLRTAGQVMFLLLSILALLAVFYNYFFKNLKSKVLIPIMCATPFFVTRGTFGVLAIYIKEMDYFDVSNYDSHGLKAIFTVYDYTLAVTMEFICACLLLSTFFVKRRWPQGQDANAETISDRESDVKV